MELQNYGTAHEMSKQQSETRSFHNTNLDRPGKTARYLQLRSFTILALHDLYSGSCAKVVILRQLTFAVENGPRWAKQQTQLGRTLVARCQYNFNSGILPRWLASGSKTMALFMKCHENDQLKADNPQHKPGSPCENWSLSTTSQLSCTASLHDLYPGSCDSFSAASCCRDVGPNGPNHKHSLEEHLWLVASTTSTVASL